jgi:outer membrane protein
MQEFSLRNTIATLALAAACATLAAAQTASAQAPAAQTAASRPNGIQAPALPASPTGNIVALPSKIAVISIQPAIMGTKEGAAAGAALQAKYAPRQAEFEKRKADIDALTEQLKKGATTLDEAAKTKLARDIDAKTKSLQRDAQEASDDSQQDMGKVYNEIGDKMLQVIEPYAYQNGYAVVLDVSGQQTPVIWAAGSANITADIIKLYDLAHPGTGTAPAAQAAPKAPPKPTAPPVVKKQ